MGQGKRREVRTIAHPVPFQILPALPKFGREAGGPRVSASDPRPCLLQGAATFNRVCLRLRRGRNLCLHYRPGPLGFPKWKATLLILPGFVGAPSASQQAENPLSRAGFVSV